jgi:excisionase family DNA binding protein
MPLAQRHSSGCGGLLRAPIAGEYAQDYSLAWIVGWLQKLGLPVYGWPDCDRPQAEWTGRGPFSGQVFRADISGYAARKWVLVHMYMAGATNSNRQTQWEPLLTPIDAADYLRLHPKTVIRMARQRQVPAIRLGKH